MRTLLQMQFHFQSYLANPIFVSPGEFFIVRKSIITSVQMYFKEI